MSEKYEPSPEEIAKIEKSRTISDAKLLKDGAEYIIDENGKKKLDVTKEQKEYISWKHEDEIERERQRLLYEHVQEQKFNRGDKVRIKFLPLEARDRKDREDYQTLRWKYISPELTRHGVKTGDERVFYFPTSPIYADCMTVTVIPVDQFDIEIEKIEKEGKGDYIKNEFFKENMVDIRYCDIESVEKVEN